MKKLKKYIKEELTKLQEQMPNTMTGYVCTCTGYTSGTTFFSDGSTGPNMLAWNLVDSSYGAGAGSSFPGTEEINGQIPVGTWTPSEGYAGTLFANMPSDSGNPYVWFTQQLYDDNGNCIPNPINCQVEEDICSNFENSIPANVSDFCTKCETNSWIGSGYEQYCECCPEGSPSPVGIPPIKDKLPLKNKKLKQYIKEEVKRLQERKYDVPPEILDTLRNRLEIDPLIRYIDYFKAVNSIPPSYRAFLHNGSFFDIIYEDFSLLIKIGSKEYYINDIDEKNYAIKHINKILTGPNMEPGEPDEEDEGGAGGGAPKPPSLPGMSPPPPPPPPVEEPDEPEEPEV